MFLENAFRFFTNIKYNRHRHNEFPIFDTLVTDENLQELDSLIHALTKKNRLLSIRI